MAGRKLTHRGDDEDRVYDPRDAAAGADDQPDRVYADEEGPGEHDRHLLDDDENDTVPCPACGKQVLAEAEVCHHCRVRFEQQAWNSEPVGGHYLDARQRQTAIVVALIVLGLLATGGYLLLR